MDLLRPIPCPHSLYLFFLLSTDSFFVDLLPSSLSCCERKTVCCLTKSHGLETGRLFRRYNGLVIPRLSSPSIPLPFPSPYPPYNPLHLASRFIVYSMIITPFMPDFWAYQEFPSLSTLHCIQKLLSLPTSQPPVARTISISSLTFPFLILMGAFLSLTSP